MSCWRTRVGSASSRSVFVTATTIGTSAARGVADRLDRLRHHTVVGRDHEDRDVGDLRAARPHGGERLVARRVDERDATIAAIDLVRADALRDAAGLARDDVRVADRVEQRRLAVVDVTHDGDDRRARLEQRFVFFVVVADEQREQLDLLLAAGLDEQHLRAERLRDELDHLVGERRRRGDHLARLEQECARGRRACGSAWARTPGS